MTSYGVQDPALLGGREVLGFNRFMHSQSQAAKHLHRAPTTATASCASVTKVSRVRPVRGRGVRP